MTKQEKEIIDKLLFELERDIKVDKKGKIKYSDLFNEITDVRIKIQKL